MHLNGNVNKHCDYANVSLNGNPIGFVQDVKYLSILLDTSMKVNECYSNHFAPICITVLYGLIPHLSASKTER